MKCFAPVLALAFGLVSAACTRPGDDEVATTSSAPDATVAVSEVPDPATSTAETAPPAGTGTAPVPTTVAPTVLSTGPVPSTAAPVPAGPTVVYAGAGGYALMPVGWWDGEWHAVGFVGADAVVPDARPSTVSLASSDLAAVLTDVPAPPDVYQCVEGPGLASIAPVFDLAPEENYPQAIAVGATWDVQPRPVRAVGLDAPDYQLAGEALVPTDTGADPSGGDVTQVIRADLDGDAIEEVLFVFERRADSSGFGAPGDFSLVVVRLPDATGAVVDQVLYSHVTPNEPLDFPMPDRGRVAAIADVNGDGTMEVAIDVLYWEGAAVEVFELHDGRLRSVMGAGCGV